MDPFEAYVRHVNPPLGSFLELTGRGHRFVRAKACVLEDAEGARWDDWVAGFGSLNLGHNPDAIQEALRAHLATDAPALFVESLNPFSGELARRLVAAAGPAFETCFFSNSGAEAVEAALKTAVAATGRRHVLHADGAFHGTTLGALSCMGRGLYREPFDAILPEGFAREVPFGDLGALEAALASREVAAFLVEPIQMESGVRIAPSGYLRGAAELCRAHGTLLVLDEVQTGMGRTGKLFAFQHEGAAPDVLCLAKSLGGGLVPIGATVFGAGIWDRAFGSFLRSEIHASTFGGNALACRAALRALELLSEPAFLETVASRGRELFAALRRETAGSRAVSRVSGVGLLGGIVLAPLDHPALSWESLGASELAGRPSSGPLLVERLARRRILAQPCGHDWSVVRVEPPLVVDAATCERFVHAVGESVRWLDSH